MVVLDKQLFAQVLQFLSTEDLKAMGREYGETVIKQKFSFFNLPTNLEALITHYFEPMGRYSGWYSFNETGEATNRILIFENELGKAWSEFLKEYIRGAVNSFTGLESNVESDGKILSASFKPRR